jgi:hypothetical protein
MQTFRLFLGAFLVAGFALAPRVRAAPTIDLSPRPRTVTAGNAATFTVAATGTPPLHFDWQRDGASLGAPNSASYTTPATTLADSGATFSVLITDSTGSAPSAATFLTVNPSAPTPFATWAAAIANPADRSASATPAGDGVPNLLKYTLGLPPAQPASPALLPQLAPSAGATVFRFARARHATAVAATVEKSTTLSAGSWTDVAAAKIADDGAFETWEAPIASADSRALYRLRVSTTTDLAPAITTAPASATVAAGGAPTFTVAATGTGPLTYQWRRNGALIAGATGASYTPPTVTAPDDGARFTVLVTGPGGTIASSEAILTVTPASRTTTYTRLKDLPVVDGGPRGVWYNAENAIVRDSVGGDLIGFFPGNSKLMAAVSRDSGRTWSMLSPSPSFWLPNSGSICQSADGKIHILYSTLYSGGVAYARFTLVRDGAGHIVNFTSDLPLNPSANYPELMLPAVNGNMDVRTGIVAGTDSAGNPRLFWVMYDDPGGTYRGRVTAGMSTVTAGWAPTDPAQWVSLTNASGATTLARWTPTIASSHNNGVHLAQHPISKDIWFEWGPLNTCDSSTANTLPVQRLRATPSGTAWSVGTAVTVGTFSTAHNYQCLAGSVVTTPHYVWFQRCSGDTGIVIDKVDQNGVVTANALPSPWGGPRSAADVAFCVNSSETEAWIGGWVPYDSWIEPNAFFAMHWDGTKWTRYNDVDLADTAAVGQSVGWDNGLVFVVPNWDTRLPALATIRTE